MKIDFNGIIDIAIPSDEELAEIYDTVKAKMQKDETIELMDAIKERTDRMVKEEGLSETFDGWNLLDKITWYVSEAYCLGFANATRTAFEANRYTGAEQHQKVKHNAGSNSGVVFHERHGHETSNKWKFLSSTKIQLHYKKFNYFTQR